GGPARTPASCPGARTRRDGRSRSVLRVRRDVCGEVSADFHRHGRGEVQLDPRDWRGVCGEQRLELPPANPRLPQPPQAEDGEEPAPGGGARQRMIADPQTQFHSDARRTTADVPRRAFIRKALHGYEVRRDESKSAFADWQHARDAAAAIKYEAVNHLD